MSSIQMKWEHFRILYEARITRKHMYDSQGSFEIEMGLNDMRLYYLQKCESEQTLAKESYNSTFVGLFNDIQSEISH